MVLSRQKPWFSPQAKHIFSETIWSVYSVFLEARNIYGMYARKKLCKLLIRLRLQSVILHSNDTPSQCATKKPCYCYCLGWFSNHQTGNQSFGPWMGQKSRHFSAKKHRKNTTNLHHLDLVLLVVYGFFSVPRGDCPRYVKTNSWDTYVRLEHILSTQ